MQKKQEQSKFIADGLFPADRNILWAAWCSVNREQAESLLEGKPTGTFLFRKDSFAEVLENQLQENLNQPVQCYTLTWTQGHHKISDYTLVYVGNAWQLYDDDPQLKQRSFAYLKELLDSFKEILKYPLYQKQRLAA